MLLIFYNKEIKLKYIINIFLLYLYLRRLIESNLSSISDNVYDLNLTTL